MELEHRFTVPTSVDVAWETFNDLERIAPCFPGASLTSFDGERFEGVCKVKLGPISLQYTGSGRFVERDVSARRAVVEAKGKDKRGNGTASAAITAQLAAAGDESTDVIVTTDLNITGRPAQFGRGVMQDVSDKLLTQFAACLETKLSGTGDESTEAMAPEAPTESVGGESPAEKAIADIASGAVETTEGVVTDAEPAAPAVAADLATPVEPEGSDTPLGDAAARATGSDTTTTGQAAEAVEPSAKHAAGFDPSSPTAKAAEPSSAPAELDLGATVLPVLVKRYAPRVVAVILLLVVLKKLLERRRS